jgi:Fe-S-cluster containining protein
VERGPAVILPVIESCDGCGACCFEQASPPGYLYILVNPGDYSGSEFAEDAERLKHLPTEARLALDKYRDDLLAGRSRGDGACIWLDPITRKCRHYEHRPSICRDELVRGDQGCRYWRKEYADFITGGGH